MIESLSAAIPDQTSTSRILMMSMSIFSCRALSWLTALVALALLCLQPASAASAMFNDEPEPAPIVERRLEVFDFTLKTTDGQAFNLREYARDKRMVIVAYVAGWCPNSNRNGHVLKRLYDKYHNRGLGVVVVMEYSDAS